MTIFSTIVSAQPDHLVVGYDSTLYHSGTACRAPRLSEERVCLQSRQLSREEGTAAKTQQVQPR
jgi:hypothetical protein